MTPILFCSQPHKIKNPPIVLGNVIFKFVRGHLTTVLLIFTTKFHIYPSHSEIFLWLHSMLTIQSPLQTGCRETPWLPYCDPHPTGWEPMRSLSGRQWRSTWCTRPNHSGPECVNMWRHQQSNKHVASNGRELTSTSIRRQARSLLWYVFNHSP